MAGSRATRELSASCSYPRISAALTRLPPFTLRSAALRPLLRRPSPSTPLLFTPTGRSAARTTSLRRAPARPTAREQLPRIRPSLSSSSSNCASTATPYPAIVELQLPPVRLLILQESVKRQPTPIFSSNGTPTDLLPIPFHTFDTRQATTRPTTHVTSITSSNSGTPKYNRSPPTSFRSLNVQLTPVKLRLAQLRIEEPKQASPRTTEDTTASPSYSLTNSP
jgi:hypothetical protein